MARGPSTLSTRTAPSTRHPFLGARSSVSSRRRGHTSRSGIVNSESSVPTIVGHSLRSAVVAKPRARAEGSSARAASAPIGRGPLAAFPKAFRSVSSMGQKLTVEGEPPPLPSSRRSLHKAAGSSARGLRLMQRRAAKRASRADKSISGGLLGWYDRERRHLPWRADPGEVPDPYKVWLSEIMLQQTTVKAVLPRYGLFLRRWPNVAALARAELGEVLGAWAGLGYYARARNLHACAQAVVEDHGGKFPESEVELRKLPGVGGYTAAAIAAIAFGAQGTPVDGNIERVVARLFAVTTPLPEAKAEVRGLTATPTTTAR